MSAVPAFFQTCGNRYRLANLGNSGFTVYTFLRGYANAMQDFLLEPEGFAALMDRIVAFECDMMRLAAKWGFDGIHFADDWGMQSGLMISPGMWRGLFKPRYARQFSLAHELGLHTWFHCCGDFVSIMEDFHEIGTDVLNISQPNVNDLNEVSRRLQGKQCFMVPISYQTVSITGTPGDIHAEVRRLLQTAGRRQRRIHRLRGRIRRDGHVRGKLPPFCGQAFRQLPCGQAEYSARWRVVYFRAGRESGRICAGLCCMRMRHMTSWGDTAMTSGESRSMHHFVGVTTRTGFAFLYLIHFRGQ